MWKAARKRATWLSMWPTQNRVLIERNKMSKRKRIFIITAIVLILLSVVFTMLVDRTKAPTTIGTLDPEDAPYSVHGAYAVGIHTMTTGGETPLELSMWYPAMSGGNGTKRITYAYKVKMGQPFGTVRMASFEGQAIQDAPYDLSMSPYPAGDLIARFFHRQHGLRLAGGTSGFLRLCGAFART